MTDSLSPSSCRLLLALVAKEYLAQHHLLHLLRDKLVSSKSRIVIVSSGAVRNVSDTGRCPSKPERPAATV